MLGVLDMGYTISLFYCIELTLQAVQKKRKRQNRLETAIMFSDIQFTCKYIRYKYSYTYKFNKYK